MWNINLSFGAADYKQLSFQGSASPLAESIVELHHYIWIFCAFILGFVLWMLFISIYYFNVNFNSWYTYRGEKTFNLESNEYNGFSYGNGSSKGFVFDTLPKWLQEAFLEYYLCKKAHTSFDGMNIFEIISYRITWIKAEVLYYWYFILNNVIVQFNFTNYKPFSVHLKQLDEDAFESQARLVLFDEYFRNIEKELDGQNEFNNSWRNLDQDDIEFQTRVRVNHGEGLEILWTIFPGIVLFIIAVPSFYILYSVDDIIDPAIFIKVIGHQWYWSYEFINIDSYDSETVNITKYNYDSYLKTDLEKGQLRLLEVDNPLFVPIWAHICFLVTSADVLHSWAVPSLGIKIDAVPGRLNQTQCYIMREGYYYGQCSELCGVNHGFMPILVIGKALPASILA